RPDVLAPAVVLDQELDPLRLELGARLRDVVDEELDGEAAVELAVVGVARTEHLDPLAARQPQHRQVVPPVEDVEAHHLREEPHGLVEAVGRSADPDDALHLHLAPPSSWSRARAARTASSTASGRIGTRFSSTRSGRKASATAFAIAAGGETAPPSPHPLIPNGFSSDRHCWWPTSIGGTSTAEGSR